MSRSLKGNYVGMAAVIHHRELQDQIDEARQKFSKDFFATLDALQAVDPDGWEAWYDGRPEETCGEILPLMKARVAELREAAEIKQTCDWLADSRDFQETQRCALDVGIQ